MDFYGIDCPETAGLASAAAVQLQRLIKWVPANRGVTVSKALGQGGKVSPYQLMHLFQLAGQTLSAKTSDGMAGGGKQNMTKNDALFPANEIPSKIYLLLMACWLFKNSNL